MDSDLAGTGTITLSAGNFLLNGQMTVSNLVFGGETVLAGTNVIADPVAWRDSARMGTNEVCTVATNGVLTVGANAGYNDFSGVITNYGSILVTNGVLRFIVYFPYGGGIAQLVNAPGGLIDLQADVDFDTYDDGSSPYIPVLINEGTLRKSGGINTSTINPVFYNPGMVDVQTGTVSLANTYDLTGGTLNFGINSLTSFGQLGLPGAATLTGAVSASLNHGYVPIGGNSFPVITYDSETGNFNAAQLPFADAWQLDYGAGVFTLEVLNARPTLLPNPGQVVKELTQLTVTNLATDPDLPAQTLTFSLPAPLAGMNLNPGTGLFTWTPAQTQSPATNTVTVVVTDNGTPPLSATNSFTVIVKEVNVPPSLPVVATQTVNELTLLTVPNTATNFNIHSTITGYALVSPPAGMVISPAGVITWTPAQTQSPGTNTITTIVTNSNPYDLVSPVLTATNSFTVIVKEVNVPPSLPVVSTQTVNELTLLTVPNTATNFNIHSTNTGYALVNPPAGMVISSAGVITWTPAQTQSPGTNTITTIVTNHNPYDLVSPVLTSTNSFTVIVKEVNVPPSLPVVSTQTVNELTLLTVPNTATNFNIHSTNTGYALVNPPAGMTISPAGVITWTPAQTQSPGTNTITTVVTNHNPYDLVSPALTSTNSFTVIVKEVNVPPSLPVVSTQTVNELTLLTVPNTATNFNIHSTITGYSLVNPPSGMTISAAGVITWTSAQTQSPGTNTITTIVTNSNTYDLVSPVLTATNTFTVIVKEVNVPPSLASGSTQIVNELTLLTVTNRATNSTSIPPSPATRWSIRRPAWSSARAHHLDARPASKPRHQHHHHHRTNSNPYDLASPV